MITYVLTEIKAKPLAIYHCSLKVFSRSQGHSAVAAAAYRSGSKLYDEQTQTHHHYSNRLGVANSFILLPENTDTTYTDRAYLWNAAEKADNRKNSRTARELVLALPHELGNAERLSLTKDMSLWLLERYNVAVDAAIHKPIDEHGDDPRNHHAHILFSTRELGEGGFGAKTRVLDDKKTGAEETELIREVWETLANDALKRAGHSDIQIDRRSLEDQGVDRIPEVHEGKSNNMEKSPASDMSEDQHEENVSDPGANSSEAQDHSHNSSSKEDQEKVTEASDTEEEGEEDQGDKESSTAGGGSGESGGLAPSLDLKAEIEHSAELDAILSESNDYHYKENESLSRKDLNTQIKQLNSIRATYSDIPLIDQIAMTNRLIEKLDIRVQHLETLIERSSLSSKLQKLLGASMKELIQFSQDIILNREYTNKVLSLTAQEKEARSARQLKRYGRTYREGVHSQIREMKQNLVILKDKQDSYQKYKGLIDKIDRHFTRAHKTSAISSPSPKISNQESSFKIALQAKLVRRQIPSEFRAKSRDERKSKETINSNTKTYIRNDQSKTISSTSRIIKNHPPKNTNLSYKLKVKSQVLSSSGEVKPSAVFKKEVMIDKEILSQSNPSWRTPPREGTPIFDPIKKARTSNVSSQSDKSSQGTAPIKDSRREWVIENSEKMDSLTEAINKKQAEMGMDSVKVSRNNNAHDMNTPKGQFNAGNDPKTHNRTTNEAQRAKSSAEAETIRSNIPPEFRAKPYPPKEGNNQTAQNDSIKDKVQSGFKSAAGAIKEKWQSFRGSPTNPTQDAPEKPKVTMSSGFNKASFEGRDQSEMNDKPKSQARKPRNE